MLFCQLGQAQSLREIYEGLQASEGKLVHLGMSKAPRHSTLAYANEHRPWEIYQDLFTELLAHLRAKLPVSAKTPLDIPGKLFPDKLFSLDSTLIDLCAKVFDWAKYRTAKGAVKIHLPLFGANQKLTSSARIELTTQKAARATWHGGGRDLRHPRHRCVNL